ncbi:[protein-PII] uridylyltransferase [Candidatus Sumerlaeota bacterium]|nr:[protein-PII] uridylyltransferase [Candidatus Sumerlaeota bacterium]
MKSKEAIKKFAQRYQGLQRRIRHIIPTRPGLYTVHRYTRGMDSLIQGVFNYIRESRNVDESILQRVALLAQGGYGRYELNLHSDIDLVFMVSDRIDEAIEDFIKAILYVLWDVGLDVGYFVRTLDETEQFLGTDIVSTTAMVESRLIAGNHYVYTSAKEIIARRLTGELRGWFIRQRLAYMEERHKRWSSSVYLLEPNVKESKGGLRDLHSLLWLGYVFWQTLDFKEFVNHSFISDEEIKTIHRALNFLHRVRNTLHLLSQRRDDVLNFEKQSQVAKVLRYKTDERLLREERLMQTYYRYARFIESLWEKVSEKMFQSFVPEFSAWERYERDKKRIGRYFFQMHKWLVIDPEYTSEVLSDPLKILTMFKLCAEHNLQLNSIGIEQVSEAVKHIDKRFRRDRKTRELFFQILRARVGGAQVLKDMHRTGFLEIIIPEFKRVRCLVRLDHYHTYTVDEHLLKTIEVSESLRQDDGKARTLHPPELIEVAHKINSSEWGWLNLALLLHDIGKGRGRGHVLQSAQLTRRILNQLELPERGEQTIHFLVSHHQLLSHVAFRHNLNEPKVIDSVAKEIADSRLLDLLYVMTYCDIKAVSPDAWNAWKAQLLYELYKKVQQCLEKGKALPAPPTKAREEVIIALSKILKNVAGVVAGKHRIETFVNNLPERYLSSIDVERAAEHFQLTTRLSKENPIEISVHPYSGGNLTEISFVTYDRPGLFRDLCLILSSSGINIINANIFTTTDGLCLDVFYVTDYQGRALPEGFRYGVLKKNFIDLSKNKRSENHFLRRQRGRIRLGEERFQYVSTQVSINNELSPAYTVLEIKTVDRPWVLYTISSILLESEINIEMAFITTEAYRVVDVFYITDLENNKIDDKAQIEELKNKLEQALNHIDLQSYLLKSKDAHSE